MPFPLKEQQIRKNITQRAVVGLRLAGGVGIVTTADLDVDGNQVEGTERTHDVDGEEVRGVFVAFEVVMKDELDKPPVLPVAVPAPELDV